MDLKTFAIRQKLLHDSSLLAYIVRNEPVPVPLIEENFNEFIAPLTDPRATRLLEDYAGLVKDEVPVLIQPNGETGGYAISGEIPDTLVEAIGLVHNQTPDDIVRALIDRNMMLVHGSTVDVVSVNLMEEAKKTLMGAQSIPDVVPIADQKPEPVSLAPEKEAVSAVEETIPNERVEETIPNERMIKGMPERMAEEVPENRSPAPVEEAANEAFFDTGADPEPDSAVPEEPEEPMMQEEPFSEKIRRIYNRVVADIRALGLDQSLNLQM